MTKDPSQMLEDYERDGVVLIRQFRRRRHRAHGWRIRQMFYRIHDAAFPLRLLPPYESVSDERFDRYVELMCEKQPQWLP